MQQGYLGGQPPETEGQQCAWSLAAGQARVPRPMEAQRLTSTRFRLLGPAMRASASPASALGPPVPLGD